MLAIQLGIVKYHCLYTQGAVAFQTPGVFVDSPGRKIVKRLLTEESSINYIPNNNMKVCLKRIQGFVLQKRFVNLSEILYEARKFDNRKWGIFG